MRGQTCELRHASLLVQKIQRLRPNTLDGRQFTSNHASGLQGPIYPYIWSHLYFRSHFPGFWLALERQRHRSRLTAPLLGGAGGGAPDPVDRNENKKEKRKPQPKEKFPKEKSSGVEREVDKTTKARNNSALSMISGGHTVRFTRPQPSSLSTQAVNSMR
jgi:hypothetical protein